MNMKLRKFALLLSLFASTFCSQPSLADIACAVTVTETSAQLQVSWDESDEQAYQTVLATLVVTEPSEYPELPYIEPFPFGGPLAFFENDTFTIIAPGNESAAWRAGEGDASFKRFVGENFLKICTPDFWAEGTPLMLDLDRNQFHLSAGPVYFDIDGDGAAEQIAWVSPNQQDAFLVLDRNGNGIVDDGTELFGNATTLIAGGLAENGYEALAEFDLQENGGLEDGVIDAADSVFSNLEVWIDVDANGISEQHEVLSLSDVGVVALELNYWESPRTDEYGNEFRYISRGRIVVNGSEKQLWVTDVFLKSVEE